MTQSLIIQGNTLEELRKLRDGSVDCIVTSPPYWGLRDYGESTNVVWDGDENCGHEWDTVGKVKSDASVKQGPNSTIKQNHTEPKDLRSAFCRKCNAWYGQLGLEPTLELYLDHMLQITQELKRVLKDTGVMFWNHGDSYGGSGGDWGKKEQRKGRFGIDARAPQTDVKNSPPHYRMTPKCMVMQNYRLILRMVDEQGWILRDILIWAKKVWIEKENKTIGNSMPSSVRDRCAFAYEPVFMLVKNKNYFFDQYTLRIPYKESINGWVGANRPNVWQVNTEPFTEAHFATFPPRLVESMIKAGCPQWICCKCGKARVRITKPTEEYSRFLGKDLNKRRKLGKGDLYGGKVFENRMSKSGLVGSQYQTIGWSDCGCGEGWEPGVVLDPFGGAMTTACVAKKLGRRYIMIELNPEYIETGKRRLAKIDEELPI